MIVLFLRKELMSAILIFVLYSVLPDTRICDLRDEIESQLNDEGIIPNDFVFLKSVGSRVTRVKYCHFIVVRTRDYMKQNYTTIHFRMVHNVLRRGVQISSANQLKVVVHKERCTTFITPSPPIPIKEHTSILGELRYEDPKQF